MEENQLWRLIARKLSGEATIEEITELNFVLNNNPQAQATYEALASFWQHPAKEEAPDNIEEIFNTHLLSVIKEEKYNTADRLFLPAAKKVWTYHWFQAAAVAAGIISLITIFLLIPRSKQVKAASRPVKEPLQEILTANGTKTNTILPDGSKVWLNSGSKLTYKTFNNSLREVELEGEAYFDVIKDAKRPFIVHTNLIDIRVLGTAFNVKSYPNEKTVEASLVRGLIEVTRLDKPDKKVMLHPNEKITVLKKVLSETETVTSKATIDKATVVANYKITGFTYSKADNSVIETSWTDNKLAFEDMPFEELAVLMERWYGVKIIFKDESVKKISFSGSFIRETVTEAFEALKLNGDFNYKINNNNNEIEIYKIK